MIIYISIGNIDDKVSQREWANFLAEVQLQFEAPWFQVHGAWWSQLDAPWQIACWCVECSDTSGLDGLKRRLRQIAWTFGQNSIAWAEAAPEFLTPLEPERRDVEKVRS